MRKLTTRLTAMLLSGILVIGSSPRSVFAADADVGQISEYAKEVFTEEEAAEESSETADTGAEVAEENVADTSEETAAQYYTVTLDANGGYFENEWDDSIGDYVQQAEVVEKQIPVEGTVAAFPVYINPNGQSMVFAGWSLEREGELISQADEEYIPVDNCTLYAVWQAEDVALGGTGGQELVDEGTEQADSVQDSEEVYTAEESADAENMSQIEDTSEEPAAIGETVEESSSEEGAAVQYYTVTLDANGGYFENEWDDAIEDYAQQAEVIEKHIHVNGTVAAFPVFTDPDGQTMIFAGWSLERDGELVITGDEEYAPVGNCVLYAVWQIEDEAVESEIPSEAASLEGTVGTGDQETDYIEEKTALTDAPQGLVDSGFEKIGVTEEVTQEAEKNETVKELEDAQVVEDTVIVDNSDEGNDEKDTAPNTYTVPEAEDKNKAFDQEYIVYGHEEVYADEDVEKSSEDASEAVVAEKETQPTLINYSEVEETVREDAVMGAVMESGACGDGVFWKIEYERDAAWTDGVLTISGSGEMTDFELYEVVDPKTKITYMSNTRPWQKYTQDTSAPILINEVIIEEGVINIGDYAFDNPCGVRKVIIPSSVKRIGYNAFNYCYLSNVDIPLGVEIIDDGAFSYCTSLENVSIPSSVKRIGRMAFEFCKLTNVTIPAGVERIDNGAFWSCKNLTEIIVPLSVTYIGEDCFSGCSDSLIIYGESGSYAETYAKENGIAFSDISQSSSSTFTIHFNANGGSSITPVDQCVTNGAYYGDSVKYTMNRPGYNFLGWYTDPVGGTLITEDTVVNLSENQTLYAHWEEGVYTVTFDPNGGRLVNLDKRVITYRGDAKYNSFPEVLRENCSLKGWYDAPSGGNKVDESSIIKFEDHVLYAQWKLEKIDVTFDANGGMFKDCLHMRISKDKSKTNLGEYYEKMPVPIKHGYVFNGWFTKQEGGDNKQEGDYIDLNNDSITLYAHWKQAEGFSASINGWPIANSDKIFSSNSSDSVIPFNKYYELGFPNKETIANSIFNKSKANCFGLCLLAVAQYEGKIDISKYTGQSGKDLCEVGYSSIIDQENDGKKAYSIWGDNQLKDVIQRAQVSQFSDVLEKCRIFESRRNDFSDIISYVRKSTSSPLIVGLYTDMPHTVVLETGIEPITNSDGTISITCYDPNYPQIEAITSEDWPSFYYYTNSMITIDQANHRWSYEFADSFRSVRKEWHSIMDDSIKFWDISNLSSSFFYGDMAFYKRPTDAVVNIMQSTYDICTYVSESRGTPLSITTDKELYNGDVEKRKFICGGNADNDIEKVLLPKGNYLYHLSGQSEMMTVSDNASAVIETGGDSDITIDSEGRIQLSNEGEDEINFSVSIACASGEGVIVANGKLNEGNSIVVTQSEESENGYARIFTNNDSAEIQTCIIVDDKVIDEGFHEEIDTTSNIVDSGTFDDAITWKLNDKGILTISGSGDLPGYSFGDSGHDKVPEYARNNEIKKLIIENGVTGIGECAFSHCKDLKEVYIPESVKEIGQNAFTSTKIEEVTILGEEVRLEQFAFQNCNNLRKVFINSAVTDGLGGAFYHCDNLVDATIQKGIVGNFFMACDMLSNITLGDGVTKIGENAFAGLNGISSISIPDTVIEIGREAFRGCENLSSISIGNNVKHIYHDAFIECTALKKVMFKGTAPVFSSDSFRSVNATAYYPATELSWTDDVKKPYGGNITWIAIKANILDCEITVSDDQCVYTGAEIWPIISIKSGTIPLVIDTDYIISCTNSTNVGTATLTITGIGNYEGTISKNFRIIPAHISTACVTGLSTKTYTGKAITQTPTVKIDSTSLICNSDYTVSYKNNINAGTAIVTITGKGNYTGTKTATFKINKATQSITSSNLSLTYPKIGTIKVSGNQGKLTYKSSKEAVATVDSAGKVTAKGAGTAKITITAAATNNFNKASKQITVTVAKAAQSITAKARASRVAVGKTTTVSITGNKGKKSYKSSDTTIATVTSAGKVTAKKVGTVKITATSAATSNYNAASKTVTIKVVPAATTSLTAANQATGIKLTWKKVTGANGYKVYRGSTLIKTITSGSTVTFADTKANTNGTKYTYKVVAKATTGDSTLSKSRAIYRVSRPAVSSVTNSASKKMTVKWGKNAKATGYQIQYSTDKTFKTGNKAVSITSAPTVSRVIGSLTKGKTYYIRIRTYKTVGSTKYWSIWSAARSVKISK